MNSSYSFSLPGIGDSAPYSTGIWAPPGFPKGGGWNGGGDNLTRAGGGRGVGDGACAEGAGGGGDGAGVEGTGGDGVGGVGTDAEGGVAGEDVTGGAGEGRGRDESAEDAAEEVAASLSSAARRRRAAMYSAKVCIAIGPLLDARGTEWMQRPSAGLAPGRLGVRTTILPGRLMPEWDVGVIEI